MLDKVMNYPKAKGYGDVLAVQEEWEAVYFKYPEVVPEGLPQDVPITSYIRFLPEKISESLRNLNEDFDTLEEVKDYVRRQVNAHRPATSYKVSKPVPMDVGVLESIRNVLNGQQTGPPDLPQCTNQANTADDHSHTGDTGYNYSNNNNDDDIIGLIASAIKGYIPKGKGKGKGKGQCHYCWQQGHHKAQCPELDRVVQQYRDGAGKGKGKGWGKSAWNEQPWSPAPWTNPGQWKGAKGKGAPATKGWAMVGARTAATTGRASTGSTRRLTMADGTRTQ